MPAIEEIPELYEIEITDLARAGKGIGKDPDGRILFVPLTAPGDRVRVRVVKSEKRYAEAELVEILRPSPTRVKPPCAVFGVCGGCQWQHLPYSLQWSTKVGGVKHALARVQVPLPTAWKEFPAERIWEYRNRVQLRGYQNNLGFFARGSHDLVPANRCEISRSEINSVWGETQTEGAALPQPFKVEVEVMPDGSIRKSWNSAHGAQGFRQIHDEQNEKLRAWVAQALTPGRPLFDLFGGDGNLSRSLTQMSSIDCVDVGSPTSEQANGLSLLPSFRFHRSSVLPWLLKRRQTGGAGGPPKSAIVDPPREGLGPLVSDIAMVLESLAVDELVAIGCDPDSWARDVSRFKRRGWHLEEAAVFDLFPQTPHVESGGVLRRSR